MSLLYFVAPFALYTTLQTIPSTPPLSSLVLASHTLSLEKRYDNAFVNTVMKDNILLTLWYLRNGGVSHSVQWVEVEKPFHYSFTLDPKKTFAFHDTILSSYQEKVAKTTNAHFSIAEGFKTDGYLAGDGVCHLASLMDWVAKDAELSVDAPANHDFARIPEVPKENGVAIYTSGTNNASDALQNIYITNTSSSPLRFDFNYSKNTLQFSIEANEKGIVTE